MEIVNELAGRPCLLAIISLSIAPTHHECVFLRVAAAFQDLVSGAEQLIHRVFVSDDVDVEGPLHLQLSHGDIRLQAEWPQGRQLSLRLPDPGQLGVNGFFILEEKLTVTDRRRQISASSVLILCSTCCDLWMAACTNCTL